MLLKSYRCYTKNYITMVYGTTDVKEEATIASSFYLIFIRFILKGEKNGGHKNNKKYDAILS